MALFDLTVDSYLKVSASDQPAPGGGSAAALAGGLAAALGQMVVRLTEGRKAFAELKQDEQDELTGRIDSLEALRIELTRLIEADTEAYKGFMAAMRLPKGTDEEKAARRGAMDEAAVTTLEVPLSTCERSLEVLRLLPLIVDKGNPNCISDVGTAAQLGRAAVEGAALNVRINLPSIKDKLLAEESLDRVEVACREADQLVGSMMRRVNEVLSQG